MRKALVRTSDGYVENVIERKTGSKWLVPTGYTLIDAAGGSPGDTWDGEKYIRPPEPEPEPDYKEQWKAAKTDSEKIVILAKKNKWE